jgi:hypothetical protein
MSPAPATATEVTLGFYLQVAPTQAPSLRLGVRVGLSESARRESDRPAGPARACHCQWPGGTH